MLRHAVAEVHLDRAVVHRDGNRDLDRLLALGERTRIRLGSRAKISPTLRSCDFASSNGFSRR